MRGPSQLFAILAALLWLAAGHAGAQSLTGKLDTDKPIEIVADSLEVLQEDRIAIFRGAVNAVQGEIRLKADELKVYYKSRKEGGGSGIAGSISRIDAAGGVFISSPSETAQGDKGIYHVDRREIELSGRVVLTRGENVIRGQRLVMNMETGRSTIDGGEPGTAGGTGRVRSIFVPADKGDESDGGERETPPVRGPRSDVAPVPASKPQRSVSN